MNLFKMLSDFENKEEDSKFYKLIWNDSGKVVVEPVTTEEILDHCRVRLFEMIDKNCKHHSALLDVKYFLSIDECVGMVYEGEGLSRYFTPSWMLDTFYDIFGQPLK